MTIPVGRWIRRTAVEFFLDVLTAGSGRPENFDPDVGLRDLNVDVFDFDF